MRPSIAIVLPAFQAAQTVRATIEAITRATRSPEATPVQWALHLVDDGSTDGTLEEAAHAVGVTGLTATLHRQSVNLGLVETLKRAYRRILLDPGVTHLLKLDADQDYAPADAVAAVLERMPDAESPFVLIGTRSRQLMATATPLEQSLRVALHSVLPDDLRHAGFDPPSAGVQCYDRATLQALLDDPRIVAHPERWGLDLALPLLAYRQGRRLDVAVLPHSSINADRRPEEKVRAQYAAYHAILERFRAN